MAELNLQQCLGATATQNSSTITLQKSELGLTSEITSADQFVAAVVLKASETLTQTHYDGEPEQNLYLESGFGDTFITRNDGRKFELRQINVNLTKLDENSNLNPEDY